MNQPVRILQILHSMNRGGAENALMNYYRHIDRSKVQFDFLLTEQNKCQFEDEIISLGGSVYRIPLLKMSNPFPYLRGIKCFFKNHPEYKIVHSHTSSKSVFPLLIARLSGINVRISHSHSSKAESGLRGKIRILLMPFLKFVASDWLTCGEQAGVYLYGENTYKSGKVKLYRNVIEADLFKLSQERRLLVRRSLGIDEDTFIVGHTARFDPVKNHRFDVDILVELKKLYPKSKLLEIGLGVKEGLSEYAVEKGVIDDIIFAGIVNNVYDYEQAMDAFILPSFNEGLPLSIVEAQVSGLPCFTTKGTVSYECSVTDLVTYTSLEEGAKVWAKKIIESKDNVRKDRYDEIVKAGYDASHSARDLQKFYLDKFSNIE